MNGKKLYLRFLIDFCEISIPFHMIGAESGDSVKHFTSAWKKDTLAIYDLIYQFTSLLH